MEIKNKEMVKEYIQSIEKIDSCVELLNNVDTVQPMQLKGSNFNDNNIIIEIPSDMDLRDNIISEIKKCLAEFKDNYIKELKQL